MQKPSISLREATLKLEHFCAYQERCHQEINTKLYELGQDQNERDEIIAHLIANNYLNEERFACAFARGKHRIKYWGNVRIVNELKFRNISSRNIATALKEIPQVEYLETFEKLSDRIWDSILEKNATKKRKKFCDYLLRKGYESDLIYQKLKTLENQ